MSRNVWVAVDLVFVIVATLFMANAMFEDWPQAIFWALVTGFSLSELKEDLAIRHIEKTYPE